MKQSGTFILNSISSAFRTELVREHSCTPNGPSIFAAIINKLQKMTSNAIRDIEGKLSKLDITLEKGENVLTFCNKVQDFADTLDQGVIYKPADLNKMVAQRFINCTVQTFSMQATNIYSALQGNPDAIHWRDILKTHRECYENMVGDNAWPPKETRNKQQMNNLQRNRRNKKKDTSSDEKEEEEDNEEDKPEKTTTRSRYRGRDNRDRPPRPPYPPKEPKDGKEDIVYKDTKWLWCGKCKRWRQESGRYAHKTDKCPGKEALGMNKNGKVTSYPEVNNLKKKVDFTEPPSTPPPDVRQSGKLSLRNTSRNDEAATQLSDSDADDENGSDYQDGKDDYENESLQLTSSKRFHRHQIKD